MRLTKLAVICLSITTFSLHAQNQSQDQSQSQPTAAADQVSTNAPEAKPIQGAVTPERVSNEMEAAAKKHNGSAVGFGHRFYFKLAANASDFEALDRYAVLLVATWSQKKDAYPIRVFIRTQNGNIPLRQISATYTADSADKSLAAKIYGPYRENVFYLIPAAMMLRDGEVSIKFVGSKISNPLFKLPSAVAINEFKQRSLRQEDPDPNAKPDLQTLQNLFKTKFTGFPIPDSVP